MNGGMTQEDGLFSLPDLPAGHYVVTAWQEMYGTQTKEITRHPRCYAFPEFHFHRQALITLR